MVNVLEQAKECTGVPESEGKNRFFGNLWAIFTDTGVQTPWKNLGNFWATFRPIFLKNWIRG
jgi:hypothetical protein